MANWQKIKTEYITTDISYRKLAQKYGIRYATVQDRAKKEDWVVLRSRYRTDMVSKTVSKIGDRQAGKMARIDGITDKLLGKLEKAVDELDMAIIVHKNKVETAAGEEATEYKEAVAGGIVDRAGLRQITAALKDLKEIQMIKSELDRREQEARIASLEKQTQKDDDREKTVIVTIAGGEGSWQK